MIIQKRRLCRCSGTHAHWHSNPFAYIEPVHVTLSCLYVPVHIVPLLRRHHLLFKWILMQMRSILSHSLLLDKNEQEKRSKFPLVKKRYESRCDAIPRHEGWKRWKPWELLTPSKSLWWGSWKATNTDRHRNIHTLLSHQWASLTEFWWFEEE